MLLQAPPRSEKAGGRRRGKTMLATSTPELQRITAEQEERVQRKSRPRGSAKNCKKDLFGQKNNKVAGKCDEAVSGTKVVKRQAKTGSQPKPSKHAVDKTAQRAKKGKREDELIMSRRPTNNRPMVGAISAKQSYAKARKSPVKQVKRGTRVTPRPWPKFGEKHELPRKPSWLSTRETSDTQPTAVQLSGAFLSMERCLQVSLIYFIFSMSH